MTSKPYLLVSDLHCHAWSAFATVNERGVNSRLQIILDELERAADELVKAGGNCMFLAGDVFHVRGSIAPSVFNPTFETFVRIAKKGIHVRAIPGNHDLEGKDTTAIGNAFQQLENIGNFEVITEPRLVKVVETTVPGVFMVPWQANKAKLREVIAGIQSIPDIATENYDLILHVGIDGMLDGVPDSGLSAKEVASWGFKRVFAGDYHNHRKADGLEVISIGATTHQTWSDIGTKAGFLLVYPNEVKYHASWAPSFVEITDEDDPDEIPLIVDGNYVRVRGFKLTDAELKLFRENLEEMGARGVTFQVAREVVGARTGSAVAKAATLDESIGKYVETLTLPDPSMLTEVTAAALNILNHVRSIA